MKYLISINFDLNNKKHLSRLRHANAVRPDNSGTDSPTIGKATRDAIREAQKLLGMGTTGRSNRALLESLDKKLLERRWVGLAQIRKLCSDVLSIPKIRTN